MIIAKPGGVYLTAENIDLNANPKVVRSCREFAMCYVDDDHVIQRVAMASHRELVGMLEGLRNPAVVYINMESAHDGSGQPDDSTLEGDEMQPMKVNPDLCFAIEGGLGWKMDQIRDVVVKSVVEGPVGAKIMSSPSVIWMVRLLIEGANVDWRRQMVFMDSGGNFNWAKDTNRYGFRGCEYSIYGVQTRTALSGRVAGFISSALHM